jgi:hypothetical protein
MNNYTDKVSIGVGSNGNRVYKVTGVSDKKVTLIFI